LPDPALIVLEDGASFRGEALTQGADGIAGGELVFTTSMTGYQEVATDPSYHGQMVTFTFPLVGNYGVSESLLESDSVHATAVLAREITNYRYNFVAQGSWLDWLSERGVMVVSGVDTRAITRHIRDRGAMRAVISAGGEPASKLAAAARALPSMAGLDLASVVAGTETRVFEPVPDGPGTCPHVVAFDYGIKNSIIRLLCEQGMRVTLVPPRTSAAAVKKLDPDGIFLANGPGDPAAVGYAVKTIRKLVGKTPIFGICLGHQLLALALGLTTYKLPFGHRGSNHPVLDVAGERVLVTTQNHGFAVSDASLPDGVDITHLSLNDRTVEGLACPSAYAFSVQFHPEASPGPHDARHLFERFTTEIERFKSRPGARRTGGSQARSGGEA